MGRKKKLKFPKTAKFKCPKCDKTSRIKVPENECIFYYECKKCDEKITTPPTRDCIVCAYTDKKCPAALKREFGMLNLSLSR